MSSTTRLANKLLINVQINKFKNELRIKNSKKGVLTKILAANSTRYKVLTDILKEPDSLNINSHSNATNSKLSDGEFLKKFTTTPKRGPKHSIAINRAHHLTKFLSQYIINAFQSGEFLKPEIPPKLSNKIDSNGFFNDYLFEISNIELLPDLSFLKIHWFCSNDEETNKFIEEYLDKSLRNQIRTALTNERVISYVPQVVFIRDKTKLLLKELDEQLLKIKLDSDKNREKNASQTPKKETKPESNEESLDKTTNINNLFGVDFYKMIETLKKTNNAVSSSDSSITSNKIEQSIIKKDDSSKTSESENFKSKLKAFQINRRTRYDQLSRNALGKLAMIEYEKFKETN